MSDVSSSDPQCSGDGGGDVGGRGGSRACWLQSFRRGCVSPVSGCAVSGRPFLLALVVVVLCGLELVFGGGVLVISV